MTQINTIIWETNSKYLQLDGKIVPDKKGNEAKKRACNVQLGAW